MNIILHLKLTNKKHTNDWFGFHYMLICKTSYFDILFYSLHNKAFSKNTQSNFKDRKKKIYNK
jgi:hypothetical protein